MSKDKAPYAYEGLDRVFHERARLGIVTSLAGHPQGLGFSELKALCGLTDGNLARHLQVLDEAGFVEQRKGHDGRRAVTRCQLTDKGRERFGAYLVTLHDVVRQASQANGGAPTPSPLRTRPA
ncbi:transcriptional regulator [uncultured Sphingomonas sp.]|uniref:transcriptional regulator n=1 Tax=uncultured Sphingomonas sp. TaxID=158754 RepID=UPI00261D3ADE|nr:transcriptional regulator [uncultured Sphingomonas sp.]